LSAAIGPEEKVESYQIGISQLWSYLETAKRLKLPGKIRLVVGQKEVDEGRYQEQLELYPDQLELYPVPPQDDGISALRFAFSSKMRLLVLEKPALH